MCTFVCVCVCECLLIGDIGVVVEGDSSRTTAYTKHATAVAADARLLSLRSGFDFKFHVIACSRITCRSQCKESIVGKIARRCSPRAFSIRAK